MLKIFKSQKGAATIDIAVAILALLLTLVLAFNALSAVLLKAELEQYAKELTRHIELTGIVDSETNAQIERLNTLHNIDAEVEIDKSGKIQLREFFVVKVTATAELGMFGGFASFPVQLTAVKEGKSEVYHKDI